MNNVFYSKLKQALAQGRAVEFATGLTAELLGKHAFWDQEEIYAQEQGTEAFWQRARSVRQKGILWERLAAADQLILCGGGHVGLALAQCAVPLGFEVTVIDDRAEFANAERFFGVNRVICAPFSQALEQAPVGANCYYVIVTPGHAGDRECLEWVLRREQFRYVGMIGSRRKTALVMEELRRQGFDAGLLERVYAPIGLNIGAHSPAEIAISIAAEMVAVRSGAAHRVGAGASLCGQATKCASDLQAQPQGDFDRRGLGLLAGGDPAVVATIVDKSGSAPREIGARMVIGATGEVFGTVGGGGGEAGALAAAQQVFASGQAVLLTFDMQNDDARKAGMICGGRIELLLERIN